MAELFQDFEINRAPRWRFLGRLLAGSFVLHALLLAVIIYVPAVRSMFRLATMFAGADYVDEEYSRIDIRERAVMLSFPKEEKLYYPAGYFTGFVNNPTAQPFDAQIVSEASMQPPPPPMPRPRRAPVARTRPTPSATPAETPEVAANKEPGAETTPTPAEQPKTDEELDKLANETNVKRFPKINAKPFKDLLSKGKQMMDKGEIDLKGSIKMTVTGTRNDDGTLSNVEVVEISTSDENLKNLALEFIQALSASKVLAALEGTKQLRMEIASEPKEIRALVTTTMESEASARDKALGYNGMLFFQGLKKKGEDEEAIYKSTKISAAGKDIKLSFTMPREAVTKMLNKQLAKEAPQPTPST